MESWRRVHHNDREALPREDVMSDRLRLPALDPDSVDLRRETDYLGDLKKELTQIISSNTL